MIKKMLAMLAVVSCAFGAWADATHISGTDFSTHGTGDFITGRDDSGAATESTYWYNGNTNDFSGTIVLGTNGTDHVLDFESNITNPVYRTIEGCYGRTVANFEPHAVGGGLFVDTYVAFTPYLVNNDHAAPTKVTPQDKIMVWVRETEVEEGANITNLIVTAGYYDAQSSFTASNYVANLESAQVSALCNGGLQRLTIKSFANITTYTGFYLMGFVVYINETPVSYTADAFEEGCPFAALDAGPRRYYEPTHMLFPSLAGYNNNSADSTLTSVGYAGVGQVGNIYFDDYSTSYPSFAGDDLDFDVVMGDGVTEYVYDNVTYNTNATFTVLPSTETITISGVQYDTVNGWKHKTGTWHNGTNVVNNAEGVGGDTGTFTLFPDALTLTLAGFKANYLVFDGVTTNEYQTLASAYAAALSAGNHTLILNSDVVIDDDDALGYIKIDEFQTIILDLNGHTIKGTNEDHGTIDVLEDGTLTVTDSSQSKAGKVLNGDGSNIAIWLVGGSTTLDDGTFELVLVDAPTAFVVNGGTYLDAVAEYPAFYLQDYVADGKSVDWNQVSSAWYATVGESAGTQWDVTFSTNNVIVTEWNLTVNDGDPIGNHIPNFTGGSWDAPAPTAETIVTSDTNFNYTVTPPVVTYEVAFSTNNIAVAEYNTNIVAGATLPADAIPAFTGGAWDLDPTNAVINAATNFNYTITPPPTGTVIYLTMGSGVDSLSTSFDGTDWTAYTDPLQDVELGSTLYIKGTSSLTGDDVPQFSIVVDDTHATEQTALVVNKSAIVYFPQTAIEEQWADRNGTAAKPFVIRNYADLVALKTGVANGTITNQCFEQVADIDMAGTGTWDCIGERDRDTSKGNFDNTFKGTYDGGCHVVSNVTFASVKYAGLFGSTYGATIKDLTVNVVGIDGSGSSYGCAAVVGTAVNSTLTGVTATGTIRTTTGAQCNHNVGGIAVRFEGSTAYGCTNKCEIWTSKEKVGGIAAFGQSDAENFFTLCSNEGDIHCSKTGSITDGGVGGIFGWQGSSGAKYQKATYTDCRSIADIDSQTDDMTGSILGKSADVSSASVPAISGTTVVRDDLRVIYNYNTGGDYGKSIGGGLVELCTQAAFETNNTYSTMWSGLTPTFAFEAAGTISFNTNLFQATTFVITCPEGYDVEDSEAGGIVTFTCAASTPTDPWEPEGGDHSDTAVSNKVADIFGDAVAQKINTYDDYTNMVAYIKSVTSSSEVPTDLTTDQAAHAYQSYMLGAAELFTEDPVISITSVAASSTAGEWDFTVVVTTETDSPTALQVAADKVKALVKVRNSLTTGSWAAPAAADVSATQLLGGNAIKVTVDYGEAGSGFMKISD